MHAAQRGGKQQNADKMQKKNGEANVNFFFFNIFVRLAYCFLKQLKQHLWQVSEIIAQNEYDDVQLLRPFLAIRHL